MSESKLDPEIYEQLKAVFAPIQSQLQMVYDVSSNENQQELLDMLEGVAQANPNLSTKSSGNVAPYPQFRIYKDNRPTGVVFKGIPGGHEFSSLILALLNADGKGKFPDSIILNRIKNIKGPVRVRTYVSLTCENCPDVVQTLNLMALTHDDFVHEFVDGGYVQDEIQSLNIQGVPSITVQSKLIHSGRITLLDLIAKLEETFGKSSNQTATVPQDLGAYDVVVVGGGPAGVSAAIYSVRKGLKTALIAEKIGGQVQETKGIENFISIPYTEGPQLSAELAKHLATYPVTFLENRRVGKIELNGDPKNAKKIVIEGGETLTAGTAIIATGARWRELGVPGEKEYLGRGVAYCPHCDGPYYKGKKVAVIGGGNSGVEAAIDLAGIVREVVVFEFNSDLKADQVLIDKLKSLPNTSVVTNAKTQQILGNGQKVEALEYVDRKTNQAIKTDLDGVFVQIGLLPNSLFLKGTVELTPFGEIIVDEKGRTSVPGIYAAGDVTTTPYKQIIIAMGEGAKTALGAFEDRMRSKV